jgi:hypothetical protein
MAQVFTNGAKSLVAPSASEDIARLAELNTKAESVDGIEIDPVTKDVQMTHIFDAQTDFDAAKDALPIGARVIKTWENIQTSQMPYMMYIFDTQAAWDAAKDALPIGACVIKTWV